MWLLGGAGSQPERRVSTAPGFQAPEVPTHGNPRVVVAFPMEMPNEYFEFTSLFIGCFTNPTLRGWLSVIFVKGTWDLLTFSPVYLHPLENGPCRTKV